MANTQSSEISQIQKVINKQDIILTQDQSHSNTIMAKTLAELENLAVLCGYKGETFLNYYATKGQTKKEMTKTYFYIPEKHINNKSCCQGCRDKDVFQLFFISDEVFGLFDIHIFPPLFRQNTAARL